MIDGGSDPLVGSVAANPKPTTAACQRLLSGVSSLTPSRGRVQPQGVVGGQATTRTAICLLPLFLGAVTTLACGKATNRSHADGTSESAAAASAPYADTTATLDAPCLLVPVECPADLGCVVRNFVDQDPGPGSCDFRGGRLAYDGHKGTDIRVPDGSKLVEGIVVLAAAGGTVARIRDGVADVSTRVGSRETVEGREAGNSVILDHGGGWETQYSHLRRASLRVAPGDRVLAGQPIALIGLSGDTEFLHLHFEIRHDGVAIDPYTGAPMGTGCGSGGRPLWTNEALAVLAYRDDAAFDAGFAVERPDAWAARAGAHAAVSITAESPALIFWVDVVGHRAGDRETMTIVGPNGDVVGERSEVIAENKVQWFQYLGKRRPPAGWVPGRYVGRYSVTRAASGTTRVVLDVQRQVVVR